MKFNLPPKKPYIDQDEWHDWFAWHPVVTQDNKVVWWEMIQRRISVLSWIYRLPPIGRTEPLKFYRREIRAGDVVIKHEGGSTIRKI